MNNLNIDAIIDACITIGASLDTHSANSVLHNDTTSKISDLVTACQAMGCPCAARDAQKWIDLVTSSDAPDKARFNQLTVSLQNNLRTELSAKALLYVDATRNQFWNDPLNGWGDVLPKLPQEATDDVTEAGKCYACSRYTACVHHLCRVLECGFKGFAERHAVNFKYGIERTSWEQLSEDLKLHRDSKKSILSSAELAAINKVRDQIGVIKTLWRNPTAHSTGTFYTDEQSLAIYHAVRQLMEDLVTL